MDRNCGKKINKNRINFMVTFKNALGHCVDVQFSGDCTCPSQGLLKIWTEHSLNLQTMKWPSREDQSGQNKTHYWVDWIIWIFTMTMTNIKLGQVKYNTLSSDALAAVCLIEMGQNSIGPNNNKVRISMPFSLNLKKKMVIILINLLWKFHRFDLWFVCIAESDHIYHQFLLGGRT